MLQENKPTIPVRKIVLIFLAIIVPLAFIWYIAGQPLRSRASSEYSKQINLYPGSNNTSKGSGAISIAYDPTYQSNLLVYLSGNIKLNPNRTYRIALCQDSICSTNMYTYTTTTNKGVSTFDKLPIKLIGNPALINRIHVYATSKNADPYCNPYGKDIRCLVASIKLMTVNLPVTDISHYKPVIVHNGNVNYGNNQNSWGAVVDGNINTYWLNQTNQSNNRAELVVDLGRIYQINKLTYTIMWDTKLGKNATIGFYTSTDNVNYKTITSKMIENSRTKIQELPVKDVQGRYVKVRWEDTPGVGWNGWSEFRELTVYGN